MKTRQFQISEDDLAEMESNLSLIFAEGHSFCVHVDGELWKKQISASRTLAALRKKLPKFVLHG